MEIQTLARIADALEVSNRSMQFSNTLLAILTCVDILATLVVLIYAIKTLWLTREISRGE